MNRPDTAAALADYVADVLAVAHLDDEDCRRLEDLEQRLRVQVGGRRLQDSVSKARRSCFELVPYAGAGMVNEVVVGVAEELRTGTSGTATWRSGRRRRRPTPRRCSGSPTTSFRIADIDERERLAAQDSTWRRSRAALRR